MHTELKKYPPAARQPQLLLIDDERSFLEMLSFRLEERGLPCLCAADAEEALALLEQPDLELALLDLNMPGTPGLDLLPLIKKRRPDMEVLLLTGESDLQAAARGMRRGAGDYLLKPVDMRVLLESIAKARQRVHEHKERLRAADAGRLIALGSLAHGVGHEINNPLQVIMQGAEWLCELAEDSRCGQPLPLEEVEDTARKIRGQAENCARITAGLLDLAFRTRSGEAETDSSATAGRVMRRIEDRARDLAVRCALELQPDLPLLPYSQAEIEPVLAHLVKNALDAVEAAPLDPCAPREVTLALRADGAVVYMEVADTGDGIAPEDAGRIFDPFFSTRPVGKGAGLGLTICHSIVTMLRGRLRYKPNTPRGTIMTVELPLVAD